MPDREFIRMILELMVHDHWYLIETEGRMYRMLQRDQ